MLPLVCPAGLIAGFNQQFVEGEPQDNEDSILMVIWLPLHDTCASFSFHTTGQEYEEVTF